MAHDVFVSYSSPNREVAQAACEALEGRGMKCWIAPRDVTAGESWSGEIVEAIAQAKLMVLVFSSQANASKHVLREVERAVHHGIPIIPLRIEKVRPTKELEYFLSVKHWLEAESRPIDPHLDRLARTIQDLLKRGGSSSGAMPTQASPFSQAPLPQGAASTPTRAPSLSDITSPAVRRRGFFAGLGLLSLVAASGIWQWSNRSGQTVGDRDHDPKPVDQDKDDSEDGVGTSQDKVPDPGDEQRLAGEPQGINLLALVDPQRDVRKGNGQIRRGQLTLRGNSKEDSGVTLFLPWNPPAAYRLRLHLGRVRDGDEMVTVGLASGDHMFTLAIDAGKEGENRTGLGGARRGQLISSFSTRRPLIPKMGPAAQTTVFSELIITVEPDRVVLQVENPVHSRRKSTSGVNADPPDPAGPRTLMTHVGPLSELTRPPRAPRVPLYVGSSVGLVVGRIVLEPLADNRGGPLLDLSKFDGER